MRFFTDQFFTDTQKAELQGNVPLNCRVKPKQFERANTVEEYLGVQRVFQSEAEIKKFEQSSRRVEYMFMGCILGLYVAVALFDLFSKAHLSI